MPDIQGKPDDKMDHFELALKRAMRRVEAPDLVARVMQAAVDIQAERSTPWTRRKHRWAFATPDWLRGWRMAVGTAVTATLLACAFLGERIQKRHEDEKAQQAQQQFEAAMTITNNALDKTRLQLERAGLALGD